MNTITTHVLDTALGKPAKGLAIRLEISKNGTFTEVGKGETDADGRLKTLLGGSAPEKAIYRIHFATDDYFKTLGTQGFFPEVSITFRIEDPTQHHHVPLLLSPYGFSTYRGS